MTVLLNVNLYQQNDTGQYEWLPLHRPTGTPPVFIVLNRCLADSPEDRFSSMDEVCELLRAVRPDGKEQIESTSFSPRTATPMGNEDTSDTHTAMILNDVGVRMEWDDFRIARNTDDRPGRSNLWRVRPIVALCCPLVQIILKAL